MIRVRRSLKLSYGGGGGEYVKVRVYLISEEVSWLEDCVSRREISIIAYTLSMAMELNKLSIGNTVIQQPPESADQEVYPEHKASYGQCLLPFE